MSEHPHEKKLDKKPAAHAAPAGAPTTEIIIAAIVAVIVLPALWVYLSSAWQSGLSETVATVFARVKLAATIISMAGVAVAIYSFIRIHEIAAGETKKLGVALNWERERVEKNQRWEQVEEYMRSPSASDWKVAILEADNILDDIILRLGYHGETLGERMKNIEPSDFPHLDEAWKAHKTRNDIAHKGGADFVLSRTLAERTINIYHRIFKELGYL
jgi:hypothetical protein